MPERNFGLKHYSSFAGADIKVSFGHIQAGELQAISYAIQREKAPNYVLGNKNPVSFSRGKRGIAGSLVFQVKDGHPLLEYLGVYAEGGVVPAPQFLSDKTEYRPTSDTAVSALDVTAATAAGGFIDEDTGSVQFGASYETSAAWYVDQLPPFDVTITAVNEYGQSMVMRIIGVEILNEGYGISVDDIVSEQQMTYAARLISPWRRFQKWKMEYDGGFGTVTDV